MENMQCYLLNIDIKVVIQSIKHLDRIPILGIIRKSFPVVLMDWTVNSYMKSGGGLSSRVKNVFVMDVTFGFESENEYRQPMFRQVLRILPRGSHKKESQTELH